MASKKELEDRIADLEARMTEWPSAQGALDTLIERGKAPKDIESFLAGFNAACGSERTKVTRLEARIHTLELALRTSGAEVNRLTGLGGFVCDRAPELWKEWVEANGV